jgi:hypothetical protein
MTTGTCADITANTDPQNECGGAQVCGMMGSCVDGPIGTVCSGGGNDCASGFCVDGYCCDSTCTGNCRSCDGANTTGGTNGVCDFIKVNTDPGNDCGGAQVCDGMGGCQ